MSIYVSHPERSSCFAQRSGYGVEGPNTACTGINAARHSHDGTVQSEFAEASTHAGLTDPGSFDCVGVRCANANSAQDDKIYGTLRERMRHDCSDVNPCRIQNWNVPNRGIAQD